MAASRDALAPQFQFRFEDMRALLMAVARLDWPRNAPPANISVPPSPGIDALLQKTTAFSLQNVTVREILDEAARQHGAMHWIVEQRVAVSGPLVRVTLAGRGWSISTTVR